MNLAAKMKGIMAHPESPSSDWPQFFISLRAGLPGPLLLLALGLAIFSSGVERAVYLLAAAVLCLDLLQAAKLTKSLSQIRETLGALEALLLQETRSLGSRLSNLTDLSQSHLHELQRLRAELPPPGAAKRLIWTAGAAAVTAIVAAGVMLALAGKDSFEQLRERIGDIALDLSALEVQIDRNLSGSAGQVDLRNLLQNEISLALSRLETTCRQAPADAASCNAAALSPPGLIGLTGARARFSPAGGQGGSGASPPSRPRKAAVQAALQPQSRAGLPVAAPATRAKRPLIEKASPEQADEPQIVEPPPPASVAPFLD